MPIDSQLLSSTTPEMTVSSDYISEDNPTLIEEVGNDSFRSDDSIPLSVMKEKTGHNIPSRKINITELLQTPPTPRRSNIHRNYKRKFHPVLTASERLEEIRRLEQEKENDAARKKARVEERELAKIKKEQLKKEKTKIRERKQEEAEQRKNKREELRKKKQKKAELRKKEREEKKRKKLMENNREKKQKIESLEALKLKHQR